jgi:hypothetical protein
MKNAIILCCALSLFGVSTYALAGQQPSSSQQAPAHAEPQGALSGLEGEVMDSTKAVLPGATVKVRDSAGREVTVTADAAGHYSFAGLAAGKATLTVSMTGFGDFIGSVPLTPGAGTTFEVVLEPEAVATKVEVKGAQAMEIDAENAEVSGTIEEERIVGLGLNGRNFTSLITLTAGVSNQTGQDEAKVGVVGSAKFSVNGGRVEYNTFDADGNDLMNSDIAASHGHSTMLVYPSLDAIQDMKVLTSNFGAQYGRSASGTVEVQIKGGEAKYHGNAYDFIRNEAFNARNFFDLPGKAPLYRRQDFGFTLGGPLAIPGRAAKKPAKTFFFVSEEWRKERSPQEFNQGVPSDAERGYNLVTQSYTNVADFSDVCPSGGFSPFTSAQFPDCPGIGHGGHYNAFANNQFYIDPNAKALLQAGLIPRANAASGCVSSIGSCYVAAISPPTDYREDLARIDHPFNDKWKIFATLIHDHWQTVTAVPQWANHVNSFPSVENSFLGPGASGIVHLTTVVSPTLVNDFAVGATLQRISLGNLPGPGVSLDTSALNGVADPIGSFFQNCAGGVKGAGGSCSGGKLPSLVFAGTNPEFGGAGFNVDTSFPPWFHNRFVFTVTDNVSKFFARHALVFGAQFDQARRHELGGANGANSGDQQGQLTFTNQGCVNSSGNAFAAFEYNNSQLAYNNSLGGSEACSYTQDNTQIAYKVGYWTLEPYIQDNFKVNSRLTLNMGVRVSLFENWTPQGTQLENWDPTKFDPDLAANSNTSIDVARGYLTNATPNTGVDLNPIPFDGSTLSPVLTNGLVRCGANGVSASCQSSHLFNTGPRVGFAYDPTGKGFTSIRAGYGVFYEHGTGSEGNAGSLMGNPPQVISMNEDNPDNFALIGLAGNGHVSSSENLTPVETPLNMISIPTKTTWPYVQQWSFGIQQQVGKDMEVAVEYVGSKGTHLAVASQLNQLPAVPDNPFSPNEPILQTACLANNGVPGTPNDPWAPTLAGAYISLPDGTKVPAYENSNGTQVVNPAFVGLVAACNGYGGSNGNSPINFARNALRPDHGIGNVLAIRNAANSAYNSLQITAHHINAPVDVAATLTYSHSIDTASDRFSSGFVNAYNLNANRASSDFDQRILVNVNYIYPLPMFTLARALRALIETVDAAPDADGKDFSELARNVLTGWSLTGSTVYQTGTPFSVFNSGSANGVSVSDNAGFALDAGYDSYPDVLRSEGRRSPCFTRTVDTGAIGPIIRNSCQFVAPRGLTQGNAGRNFMNNPSRINFDAALLKDMKLREAASLQFRAEAFNVFNHTQFILYDPTKGNTSSNTISCYGDVTTGYSAGAATCDSGNGFLHPVEAHRPRTVQFGLKLQF